MPRQKNEKIQLALYLADLIDQEKINFIESIKLYRLARYCTLQCAAYMMRRAVGRYIKTPQGSGFIYSFLPVDTKVLIEFPGILELESSYLIVRMTTNRTGMVIRKRNAIAWNIGEEIRVNFFDMKKTRKHNCEYKTVLMPAFISFSH